MTLEAQIIYVLSRSLRRLYIYDLCIRLSERTGQTLTDQSYAMVESALAVLQQRGLVTFSSGWTVSGDWQDVLSSERA